jgi:tetratricopeptide (TPR) repeat protein
MSRTRLAVAVALFLARSAPAFAGTAVADDTYLAAERLLGAGRWTEAAVSFGVFLKGFPDDPRAREAIFRRGEALFRGGRLEEALVEFDAAGPDLRSRFRAANTLYLLGRAADASVALSSILDEPGLKDLEGPIRYFLARSLLARGKPDEARAVLEAYGGGAGPAAAYVKLALGDVEAAQLGMAAEREGEARPDKEHLDRTLSAYRDVLETATEGRLVPETLFRIAELLRWSGMTEDAARHYRRAVEVAPSGPVAPYAKLGAAWAALGSGDGAGALAMSVSAAELARGARISDPRLADEIAYALGSSGLAAGRYDIAAESLSPLHGQKKPTVPRDRLLHRLAWSAIFAGKADLARASASALLAMDPPAGRAAEAHLVAGESELVSGQPAKALEHFASAAEAGEKAGAGKTLRLAAYGHARALAAIGKPSEAAREFDAFSSEYGPHPLAACATALAARAYLAAGRDALAAERFREARDAYRGTPLEAELVWGESLAEYMRGDFDAMAALDREIVEKFPGSSRAADAAYWSAWSQLQKKDFAGAAEAFRDAARRAEGRPGLAAAATLEAASALERAGDRKGALATALDLVTGALAEYAPLEAVLWTADALHQDGRTDRAAGILDAALRRAAGGEAASRVLYARAELLRGTGRAGEAIGLFDKVLAAAPGDALAAASRLGKARCLLAKGRRAEAEVVLENALDRTTGWGRAAAYCELGEIRLGNADSSQGEKRTRLAERAAEDFMLVVLLYEPEGPGEGAELAARALVGAARAYVLIERYASARDRLEQLIMHPLYGTLPEAREARKLLQRIPVDATGGGGEK